MQPISPNTDLGHARAFRGAALLVIAMSLLGSFFAIGGAIGDARYFAARDDALKESMYRHAMDHPTPRRIMQVVTFFGDVRFLIPAATTGLVILSALRGRILATIWAFATLGGYWLIHGLKVFYGRARPDYLEPILTEGSMSFPSFHAAGSAMFYGMCSYLLIRETRRVGWLLAPLLGLFILLIAFSRVYLGAHWFSDVIAGTTLGFGWVALAMAAAEWTRKH